MLQSESCLSRAGLLLPEQKPRGWLFFVLFSQTPFFSPRLGFGGGSQPATRRSRFPPSTLPILDCFQQPPPRHQREAHFGFAPKRRCSQLSPFCSEMHPTRGCKPKTPLTNAGDPGGTRPTDWDDEEDGEWEAPVISNPKCSVGCGKWEAGDGEGLRGPT